MPRTLIVSATLLGLAAGVAAARADPVNTLSGTMAPNQVAGSTVQVADSTTVRSTIPAAPAAPGNAIAAPPGVDPMIWESVTTGRTGAYGVPATFWQEVQGQGGGG